MNIKNAKYKNTENTIIDVEIEHPTYGWIPYTFNTETEDESFDEIIRVWLDSNSPSAYIVDLETEKQAKISQLKANTNYEESVLANGVYYKGGYDSAQKLDSKRRLVIESGGSTVQFIDENDEIQSLTLDEAKTVCLAVANDYESKFYKYKVKKKEIEACTTIEELEAITI